MKKKYTIVAIIVILVIVGGIYAWQKNSITPPDGTPSEAPGETPERSFVKVEIPEGWVLYKNESFNIQFFYPPEFNYTENVSRVERDIRKGGKVLHVSFKNFSDELYDELYSEGESRTYKEGDLLFGVEVDGGLSEQYKGDFDHKGQQEGKGWLVDVFAVSDSIDIRKGVGGSIEKEGYIGTDFVIAFNGNPRMYIANYAYTDFGPPENQAKEAEIIERIALTVREID